MNDTDREQLRQWAEDHSNTHLPLVLVKMSVRELLIENEQLRKAVQPISRIVSKPEATIEMKVGAIPRYIQDEISRNLAKEP